MTDPIFTRPVGAPDAGAPFASTDPVVERLPPRDVSPGRFDPVTGLPIVTADSPFGTDTPLATDTPSDSTRDNDVAAAIAARAAGVRVRMLQVDDWYRDPEHVDRFYSPDLSDSDRIDFLEAQVRRLWSMLGVQ